MPFAGRCFPLLDRLSNEVEENERKVLDSQEELISSQRALLEAQDQLVKLQCQLLEKRDKEITAVQSTAEEEIKTFASVIQKGCDTALAPKRIRTAISSATEDRVSNLIVHGLDDFRSENNLDLGINVRNLIESMGENTTEVWGIERIGRYREGIDRAVKLRLSGRNFRDRILSKKSGLKTSEDFKHVYISHDRSPEEREERWKLISELKERKEAEPGKTFGIRGDKVVVLGD